MPIRKRRTATEDPASLGAVRERWRAWFAVKKMNWNDVDIVIADATRMTTAQIVAFDDRILTTGEIDEIESRLRRRLGHEPLQYIRGWTEFYGRPFAVDTRVLIPRPDTETLVEEVLKVAPAGGRILDLGTGTGCIAISVALERPDTRVIASDRSFDALLVARHNARVNGADVAFVCADALEPLRGPVDLIATNPPYIPVEQIAGIDPEVRDWEPRMALTTGRPNPYEIIERIFEAGASVVRPGGQLLMEIGFRQNEDIANIARGFGWTVERFMLDLASIQRAIVTSRPAAGSTEEESRE